MAVRLETKMSARSSPKDIGVRRAVLSASFDNTQRAQTMNARENMRLEKQQRDFDLFKNNVEKTYMVEKNRVKSRMQNLRKNVLSRTQSNETVSSVSSSNSTNSKFDAANEVHLPKLASPMENAGRKLPGELELSRSVPDIHLICGEKEQRLTHLPSISTNSPRVKKRLTEENIRRIKLTLSPPHSPPYARTRSHEDIHVNTECPLENNRCILKLKTQEANESITLQREFLYVGSSHCSPLTSHRRSLSTSDITLTERIHCFLESVDNSQFSTDTVDNKSFNSEDEQIFGD